MKNGHEAFPSTSMSNIELWHQIYAHLNHNDLILLQKKFIIERLPNIKGEHFECEGCALGKKRIRKNLLFMKIEENVKYLT